MKTATEQALREAGVRTTVLFDGARFELPLRPAHKGMGLGLLLVGLFITAFMVVWMGGPITGAFRFSGPFRWSLVLFGLLGLPGLGMGLAMMIRGATLVSGRSRESIEMTRDLLRVTEHLGPFRWTRKLPREQIRRFTRKPSPRHGKGPSPASLHNNDGPCLWAENTAGKPFRIAPFYSTAVLDPLAAALAEVMERPAAGAGAPSAAATDNDGATAEEGTAPAPPPNTAVTIRDFAEGFAIDAPPVGLRRGSQGLFIFSLVWLGMCGLIFTVPLWGGGRGVSNVVPWILFALLFVGIGLAMLAASIHMGRRRVMIAVNARTVGLRQIGIFGARERRFPRAEVADVCVGPSGMEINNRPVMELQFRLRDRKKVGCLSSLSEEELHWLAAVLRRRLGLSVPSGVGGVGNEPLQ